MLNLVVLVGRLGRDCVVEKTATEMKDMCRFTLGVQENPKANTEWIDCVTFDQPAQFLGQYGKKGKLMLVVGYVHKSSYMKDDHKVYRQNIVCRRVKALERSNETTGYQSEVVREAGNAIINDPQYIDDSANDFSSFAGDEIYDRYGI